MKIREPLLERRGKDRDEVFDEALVNTYFLSPPRIYQWEKMLFSESYEGDNFMNLLSDYPLRKGVMGNCLSTTKRTNGAAAVFLPAWRRGSRLFWKTVSTWCLPVFMKL